MTDLLAEALSSLERVGCQFWACKGPTSKPEDMATCHVCELIYRLRAELDAEVRITAPVREVGGWVAGFEHRNGAGAIQLHPEADGRLTVYLYDLDPTVDVSVDGTDRTG